MNPRSLLLTDISSHTVASYSYDVMIGQWQSVGSTEVTSCMMTNTRVSSLIPMHTQSYKIHVIYIFYLLLQHYNIPRLILQSSPP